MFITLLHEIEFVNTFFKNFSTFYHRKKFLIAIYNGELNKLKLDQCIVLVVLVILPALEVSDTYPCFPRDPYLYPTT